MARIMKEPHEDTGLDLGLKLFRQQCAVCHGADGEGITGLAPPLLGPGTDPLAQDPKDGDRVVLNVALTGNVASGKSAVADLWATVGVPLVSADVLARQAVEPGSAGLARVEERFGPRMLLEDGRLDRAALRARVFADPEARRDLEGIIHPIVWSLRADWLEALDRRKQVPARHPGDRGLAVIEDAPGSYVLGM